MANKVENDKGFLVIATTSEECFSWGGIEVCDHCGCLSNGGYLIAVLNHWCCQTCYNEWLEDAIVYQEDKIFEKRIYNRYAKNLNLETV